jgi:DNA-binding MarR family transcriptional regulator
MDDFLRSAEAVSLFCRINVNTRRGLPVRAGEMGLLILLVRSAQPPTPLEVARFFRISKPMVTAMVRSLESKGYVEKARSTVDHRSFSLLPTEKAKIMVEETYREYLEKMEALREGMGGADFERFIGLIERANAILLQEEKNG